MSNVKMIRMNFPREKGETALEAFVPDFDWEDFKNLPLAREVVRKKYEETLHKLVVEIDSHKNGTSRNHINSRTTITSRFWNLR